MIRALTNTLSSISYPQACRVCSGDVDHIDDGVACASCWNETRMFTGNEMLCRKCGAFFASETVPVSASCHKCDQHDYDKASALGVYEKALAVSIVNLKSVPHMPRRLAGAISSLVHKEIFHNIDVLIRVT